MKISKIHLVTTVLSVLSFFAGLTAVYGAPVIAGPEATASEIRTAHGMTANNVHRLIFKQSGGHENATSLRADLASDYILLVEGNKEDLIDFKLRRHIVLDSARQTFENFSLYAEIAFRAVEFQNRQFIAGMLTFAKVKTDKVATTPSEIEAELGIALPNITVAALTRKTDSDGTIHFLDAGKELARVRFGSTRLTADEAIGLARFLHYAVILHPYITQAIMADGRMPTELTYSENRELNPKERTLILESDNGIEADYPLPATYQVDFSRNGNGQPSQLEKLLPVMFGAVKRQVIGGPKSIEDYRNAIGVAIQKKQNLQTALLFLELSLHHGSGAVTCSSETANCYSMSEVMRSIGDDPDVKLLLQGLSFKGSHAAEGVAYFRKVNRNNLSNAYVMDIFTANDLGTSEEAIPLYFSVIRGNPYVSGFYKDFGDFYFHRYDTWDAWILYDLGRNLPNANETPMIDSVDALELRLATDFPYFF